MVDQRPPLPEPYRAEQESPSRDRGFKHASSRVGEVCDKTDRQTTETNSRKQVPAAAPPQDTTPIKPTDLRRDLPGLREEPPPMRYPLVRTYELATPPMAAALPPRPPPMESPTSTEFHPDRAQVMNANRHSDTAPTTRGPVHLRRPPRGPPTPPPLHPGEQEASNGRSESLVQRLSQNVADKPTPSLLERVGAAAPPPNPTEMDVQGIGGDDSLEGDENGSGRRYKRRGSRRGPPRK